MMLSQKEGASLLEILAQEDKGFEAASAAFQRAFQHADHFRVASAMCVLLEDGMLPSRHSLAALYIVHQLYKDAAPGVHPFMPFLVSRYSELAAAEGSELEASVHQRNLLALLLAAPAVPLPKDLCKKSPVELCAAWRAGSEAPPAPNVAGLRAAYAERDARVPEMQRAGISPLVEDREPVDGAVDGTGQQQGGSSDWGAPPELDSRLGLLRLVRNGPI